MIARNLFETAVEIALIHHVQDAAEKIAAFSGVEKLCLANKLVKFKEAHREQAALWPGDLTRTILPTSPTQVFPTMRPYLGLRNTPTRSTVMTFTR